MRWTVLDELINQATQDTGDVLLARELYNAQGGKVHEEHELFSERTDAFIEWYLLERRGADGRTPLDRLLTAGKLAEPDVPTGRALQSSYRSLFQVLSLGPHQEMRRRPSLTEMISKRQVPLPRRHPQPLPSASGDGQRGRQGIRLCDLLGGGRFEVDERRSLPGVSPGDIFETRLVPDPDQPYRLVFTRTFLCHPREARASLLAQAAAARRCGEDHDTVLFRLQRLRLRCVAYRHVPAARIYAQYDAPP